MHSGIFQLSRYSRNTWHFSEADHPNNSSGIGNLYSRSGKRSRRTCINCLKECCLNGTPELGEIVIYNARSCIRLINYKWGSPHLKLEEEVDKLFDSQGKYYLQCNVSLKVTVIIRAVVASTAWDV